MSKANIVLKCQNPLQMYHHKSLARLDESLDQRQKTMRLGNVKATWAIVTVRLTHCRANNIVDDVWVQALVLGARLISANAMPCT